MPKRDQRRFEEKTMALPKLYIQKIKIVDY